MAFKKSLLGLQLIEKPFHRQKKTRILVRNNTLLDGLPYDKLFGLLFNPLTPVVSNSYLVSP